jgi:putative transposase
MKKSRFSDEQIVAIVRESYAHDVATTAKKYKVSQHTLYIWRRKFGTMDAPQVGECTSSKHFGQLVVET